MKKIRILILILLFIVVIAVTFSRPKLVLGGESLLFVSYLIWAIYANITGVE